MEPLLFTPEELRASIPEYRDRVMPRVVEKLKRLTAERKAAADAARELS